MSKELTKFIPVVGPVVEGVTTLIGAHHQASEAEKVAKIQADAANRASDLQAQAQKDALAAQTEQNQYDRYEAQAVQDARRPGVDLSNSSLAAIAGKLGVQPVNFSVAPTAIPQGGPRLAGTTTAPAAPTQSSVTYATPSGPQSLASLYQQAQATTPNPASETSYGAATPMVKVKAPTGEVAMIPRDQLARAVSLGAQQVA